MKTTALTRIYALAISALFASLATVGVAVLMASSGEQARTDFAAKAVARQSAPPATRAPARLAGAGESFPVMGVKSDPQRTPDTVNAQATAAPALRSNARQPG